MLGDDSYAAWVKEFDTVGARERIVLRRNLRTFIAILSFRLSCRFTTPISFTFLLR